MQSCKIVAAQGDLYIRRIDKLPEGSVPVPAIEGRHILAHSETGHHHVMLAERVNVSRLPTDDGKLLRLFFEVAPGEPVALKHLRPFDTHEPIMFSPGVYEARRQREYTPEGFRAVAD